MTPERPLGSLVHRYSRRIAVGMAVVIATVTASTTALAQDPPAASSAAVAPITDESVGAADWPVDRGNPAATGAVPQTLASEIAEKWRFETGRSVEGSAVVAAGRVFLADVEGTVYALNLADGSVLWKQQVGAGYAAPPAASADLVIVGDFDGIVWALDAATGQTRWQFPTGGQIDAGAAIVGDLVLATSQDGNLYAIDRQSGQSRWTYQTGDQIRCRPTVGDGLTFLGGCDAKLHTVAIATGEQGVEPLALDGPTGSTPAILGDMAFLPTQSGSVLAFQWKEGELVWSYTDPDRPQEYRNSAAVTEDRVVVASQNRQVVALDPTSGKEIWKTALRRRADGSPVIAGEDVWIAATDGRLYRLALSDGEVRWEYEFRGSFVAPPAVAGDRLLLVNDDGTVICLGPQ